ncbi:MAG TPA: cbb3-type cytochrome c oxidase N-terminal domain-containing protein, partial [Rhodocyclaceae bacterium]|nr:cbb3-type cytochrome c oxidase N-terminal domain-containing protein [Rhodocyclaceae bacterium]
MSDFVSGFWSVYVALITLVSVVGCGVFLWVQSKAKGTAAAGQAETMGHVWDETLQEYNNPLPRWWSWLFYITV